MTPNEKRRIKLMNEIGLTYLQAGKIVRMVKEWK